MNHVSILVYLSGLILSAVIIAMDRDRIREGDIYFHWTTVIVLTCSVFIIITPNLESRDSVFFSIFVFIGIFFLEASWSGKRVDKLIEKRRRGESAAVLWTERGVMKVIAKFFKLNLWTCPDPDCDGVDEGDFLTAPFIMDRKLSDNEIRSLQVLLGDVPLNPTCTRTIGDILRQAVRYP